MHFKCFSFTLGITEFSIETEPCHELMFLACYVHNESVVSM